MASFVAAIFYLRIEPPAQFRIRRRHHVDRVVVGVLIGVGIIDCERLAVVRCLEIRELARVVLNGDAIAGELVAHRG